MVDHVIRLRAAWEARFLEGDALASRRIDLPVAINELPKKRFRLRRTFGAPPIIAGTEEVALRLCDVSGLRAVWLNGRMLTPSGSESALLEYPLDELRPARNELVLEVDPLDSTGTRATPALWGQIALVIRRRRAPAHLGDRESNSL
jgi:hypothetical protein